MNQLPALIGGKPVATTAEVPVEDPSTGEVMTVTADCGPAEIDAAVRSAADAAQSWRRGAAPERGQPLRQGLRDAEITVRYFDFYASAVETFYGAAFSLDDHTAVQTRWEPHGVTGHVIPWNYPMQILGRSVAPALAMGNCVVLKPAEEAPLTALKIGELALEAGLPPGALNVVTGYGESAGAALTAHPGVGHISFTGSVEVGRIIAHAAAERLIPVTMELGGKSPNILFADADLDRALPVIANSILQNGGQTCSAGSRLLVEESVHAAVVSRLAEIFAAVGIGPALEDPDLGPLISGPQRDRVNSYVAAGGQDGRIAYGGAPLNGGRLGNGYFFQPTLIDDVVPGSTMFREEVFGPVLAVTPFADISEAVALANGTDYGLVAGVWTTNISTAQQVIRDVVSGQVFVNTYGASGGVELPFGGFRQSGYGREKGLEGLRGFTQVKTAVIAS